MLAETLDGERFGQLKIQRFHHNSTHFILFARKFFGLEVKKGLKFNLLSNETKLEPGDSWKKVTQ